jgi:hypothetical protein
VVILLLWPWTRTYGTRFLIPVAPFVFCYFLTGVAAVTDILPFKRSGRTLFLVVIALLFVSNSIFSYRFLKDECPKDWSGKPAGHYMEMTRRVNEIAPADASFITWNSAIFYVWSHRKSLCMPYIRTVSDLEKAIKGNPGSYIIDMDAEYDPEVVQPFFRQHPDWLYEIFNKDGLKVYKIR